MSYSVDYRKRVLTYLEEGHTQAEAQKVFKVGATTIKAWKRLLSEGKTLVKKTPIRTPRVYPSDKLRAYVKEHPQALLKEIAEHFGGSISGADFALRREKITLKKRQFRTVNAMKKSVSSSRRK